MAEILDSPFDAITALQRALERAMGVEWFGPSTGARGPYPHINVFQDNHDYIVVAEMPGVSRETIDIEVLRNRLRIKGAKRVDFPDGASVHRRERQSGAFDRTVTLPFEVDADRVQAEFRNGVLALVLPRTPEETPRSIAIK